MTLEVDRTFEALNHGTGWPHGKPKALVVHATRGGVARRQSIAGHRRETSSTINWFLSPNSRASTNLIVSPIEIVRMVSDEDFAWHAWEHSSRTYSIELTQSLPTDPFLDGHYELLARAGRHYVSLGVPPVYLPHYSNGMEGFTGHEDSEQGVRDGKSDPGRLFDWDRFIAMIQEPEVSEEDDMFARIIKVESDPKPHNTYLWRPGKDLLHMKSLYQRQDVAKLYGISVTPVTVDQATLNALK